MLKKISDIVINTSEDEMFLCPKCREYFKITEKIHKCKNCNSNKDIENGRNEKLPHQKS